jgi:hypothetical protein
MTCTLLTLQAEYLILSVTRMYDMVVSELLSHDRFDLLCDYIVKWNNNGSSGRLFSTDVLLVALEQRLHSETNPSTREALQKCIDVLGSAEYRG